MAIRSNATRGSSNSPISGARPQVNAGSPVQSPAVQFGTKPQEMKDQPQRPQQGSTPMQMAQGLSEVTESMVAQRAYEIWQSQGGSELDNWLKAERELRDRNMAAMRRASR